MLHLAMAAGLLLGIALGLLASFTDSPFLFALAEGVEPLGRLFVNAIRMVVIPLVMVVIFTAVTRLGDLRRVGRMGAVAVGFWWGATLVGILLGMGIMTLALPWVPDFLPEAAAGEVAGTGELPGLVDFLVGIVPANPFAAASDGDLLSLIVFSALFAAAAGTLAEDRRARLLRLADDVSAAFFKLVHWILWTAPVGIFALIAPVTARTGWATLQGLIVFIGAVLVGLFVLVALVYAPAVRFLGRQPVGRFARESWPATLVAFTTTSGVPALPVMLESADELGLSRPVADFVLPLGTSIHRSGSALFQGAAVIFLAHVQGGEIPVAAGAGAVVAIFLAALSVAPVPSASIVTLAPALEVVGVPLAGLGLLLGVDRIPDMFRSAVNINGHMVGAVVVEGTVGGGGAAGPVDGAGKSAEGTAEPGAPVRGPGEGGVAGSARRESAP